MTDSASATECAQWLFRISRDLRAMKTDRKLVLIHEDGVSDVSYTLADELELVAMKLDYDAVMTLAAEMGPIR